MEKLTSYLETSSTLASAAKLLTRPWLTAQQAPWGLCCRSSWLVACLNILVGCSACNSDLKLLEAKEQPVLNPPRSQRRQEVSV